MNRTWLKWTPAVAVPAVIAVGVLAVPLQAGAAVDLPEKSPQAVLELAAGSTVDTFSGTLEQTSDLGLPELPSTGDAATGEFADALDLLSGDHTVRVYQNGAEQSRVQVQDTMSERNLIQNGSDLWLYDSADNTVTHTTLPAGAEAETPEKSYTPAELAQTFLDEVSPTTIVSLGENTQVAGRSAYELVLTPNTDATLVGSVAIAVDAENGMPLRVEVDAGDATEPAISVAFTSLSLQAPAADLFDFTPPEGAAVTEETLPSKDEMQHPEGDRSGIAVIGTGWDAVVSVPAVDAEALAELTASPLYSQLTDAVDGGRALSSTLVSVLVTDDGRVFAGSVPVQRLQAAAAQE
jgi:outer membrane lipoprotein-sorting protein